MRILKKRTEHKHNSVISYMSALILLIVGFLISQPFIWIVMILGYNFHHTTFPVLLMVLGFIVGAPMFMFSVFNLFVHRSNGTTSTTELDIGRIRYSTEDKNRR